MTDEDTLPQAIVSVAEEGRSLYLLHTEPSSGVTHEVMIINDVRQYFFEVEEHQKKAYILYALGAFSTDWYLLTYDVDEQSASTAAIYSGTPVTADNTMIRPILAATVSDNAVAMVRADDDLNAQNSHLEELYLDVLDLSTRAWSTVLLCDACLTQNYDNALAFHSDGNFYTSYFVNDTAWLAMIDPSAVVLTSKAYIGISPFTGFLLGNSYIWSYSGTTAKKLRIDNLTEETNFENRSFLNLRRILRVSNNTPVITIEAAQPSLSDYLPIQIDLDINERLENANLINIQASSHPFYQDSGLLFGNNSNLNTQVLPTNNTREFVLNTYAEFMGISITNQGYIFSNFDGDYLGFCALPFEPDKAQVLY